MADAYLKVVLDSADKHFIVYIDLPQNWDSFLEEVKNIFPEENFGGFRKYWTDHEHDKIDIVDNKSYQIFRRMSSSKKIFLQKAQAHQQSEEPLEVHERVTCDACNAFPIVGFRYKCVQCPDYDLCGNCEANRVHKEHVMFRFPAPVKNIPFNRRFLKKMKKGCFIHPESEEGNSHHHSRRHCRNNIFSSLYTMMQDMAEGTECPATEQDDEGVESGMEGEKSEKRKKEKEEKKKPRKCNMREIPVIDPSYVKAGVEILGNFSEMFSKMINPSAVPMDVDVVIDIDGSNGKDSPKKDDSPKEKSKEAETAEDAKSDGKKEPSDVGTSNGDYVSAAVSVEEGASALISDQASFSKQTPEQERDVLGWTVINPPPESFRRRDSTTSSSSGASRKSGNKVDSNSREGSPTSKYVQISKDLYEHLQREKKSATAPVETPPPSREPSEKRAMIVYHKDHRINSAVHAMMGMGFSNEGNWLTYLLESVNGDIAQAIDLMKPVK